MVQFVNLNFYIVNLRLAQFRDLPSMNLWVKNHQPLKRIRSVYIFQDNTLLGHC